MIELFGRMHPLMVHFPIVLLLIAAGLEVWRLKTESLSLAHFLLSTSLLGAFFATAAVATGWEFSDEFHRSDTAALLTQHRWLGVATMILAIVTAGVVWRWNRSTRSGQKWFRRVFVWATAATLVVAAHVGAMAVWGEDFFSI